MDDDYVMSPISIQVSTAPIVRRARVRYVRSVDRIDVETGQDDRDTDIGSPDGQV